MGPTCSPSTTMCQPPSDAGCAAASVAASPPRTTMMWLHFLQRILKTLPRTLSSEIEYLVEQESQTIFISASLRIHGTHGEPGLAEGSRYHIVPPDEPQANRRRFRSDFED